MLLRYRSFRSVSWEIKKRRGRGEAYGGGDEGMSSIFGFPVLVFAFSMIPHTCLDTPSFEIFANSAAKVPLRHRWDCVLNRGKCRRQCYCAIAQACLVGALCELFRFSLSRIYNVVCLIQLIHGQTMVRENPYVWSLLFLVLSCLGEVPKVMATLPSSLSAPIVLTKLSAARCVLSRGETRFDSFLFPCCY